LKEGGENAFKRGDNYVYVTQGPRPDSCEKLEKAEDTLLTNIIMLSSHTVAGIRVKAFSYLKRFKALSRMKYIEARRILIRSRLEY
jgi:hypothetical protein